MHTLTTKDRHGVLCVGRIRRLTPRECLRLQGWTDDRIDTVLAIQSDNQAWRLFNSTLHAGEVKANIILAMAISAQAINQKYTQFKKTPIGDNPAFIFRTFLLRLGLIGPEYKNVRMHLLKNLPGDKAWRHDKSLYPSNQPRLHTDEVR